MFRALISSLLTILAVTSAFSQTPQGTRQYSQAPTIQESNIYDSKPAASKPKPKSSDSMKQLLQKGPTVNWIWVGKGANNDEYYFKRKFSGRAKAASLLATCDNGMTVYLNGKEIASSNSWESAVRIDGLEKKLLDENELLIRGTNEGSLAGLAVKLVLQREVDKVDYIVSDKDWFAAKERDATKSLAISVNGKMGDSPWGNVFRNASSELANAGNRNFNVREGFQVEELFKVPKNELGSWVSICVDPKGRIIASDQGNRGLCRITPGKIGTDEPTKVEKLDLQISSAQGLLCAFDALYICVNGGRGSGLYRARDTNDDDQYDELVRLKSLQGGGEHGPHALRLSPDGQSIYVIAGNHTNPPKDFQKSRLPSNWSEDHLLPRQWDARGHARGKLAPGGWIAKTDPDGKQWEMISVGYRNPYDMDFNADGELFAYDADMEWDMGTPWYRPTRVVHATSGSEFGWRSGTGKWPTYYIDSLPQVCDIGPGSPVGAAFGYGAKFPAKYQKAFFICDWTFGTMYAIHLKPKGASYVGQKEEFVSRSPLPLTDVAIGKDGAMYFTVGGRGTQSALYRVTYVGDEPTTPANAKNEMHADLRALRQKVEKSHSSSSDLSFLTSQLSNTDRHIRYAARVGLENADANWNEILQSMPSDASTMGLCEVAVGVAHQSKDETLRDAVITRLSGQEFSDLTDEEKLAVLRAYSLLFVRIGKPNLSATAKVLGHIEPSFPAKSDWVNRELVNVLVYLDSKVVIERTLELMRNPKKQTPEEMSALLARNRGYGGAIAQMLSNLPELQNIHYAFALRNMRYGWTLEQRKEYFAWLNAALSRSGGASYQGFINNIRNEAMENLSEAEKLALKSETIAPPPKSTDLPEPIGPPNKLSDEEVLKLLGSQLKERDFAKGKKAFASAKCIVCHRFDGFGGATGPDLTNAAGRFSKRDLLESLSEPSKVISDQYRAHIIDTVSGKSFTGRIASESDGKLKLLTDPEDANKFVEISLDDIDEKTPSPVSLMPADLLKPLNQDELLDLFAYLLSRGNPKDPVFKK